MKYKMSGVIIHSYVDRLCCDKQTNIDIFAESKVELLNKKEQITTNFEWGEPGDEHHVRICWSNYIWVNERLIS